MRTLSRYFHQIAQRSKISAYLQFYTFHDKNAHIHYDKTVVYPISQEMHVHQDAGGHFYISSFNGRGTEFQVLIHIIYVGNGENEAFSVK